MNIYRLYQNTDGNIEVQIYIYQTGIRTGDDKWINYFGDTIFDNMSLANDLLAVIYNHDHHKDSYISKTVIVKISDKF